MTGAPPEPQPSLASQFAPLDPAWDEQAAAVLADALGSGSPEAGRALLAEARASDDTQVRALVLDGRLVAVSILRKAPLANDLVAVAVAPDQRRRGIGRESLVDAIMQSGRRPLTVETGEAALGFFKRCGFKIVGRRARPGEAPRYRLGWHLPGMRHPVPGAAPDPDAPPAEERGHAAEG